MLKFGETGLAGDVCLLKLRWLREIQRQDHGESCTTQAVQHAVLVAAAVGCHPQAELIAQTTDAGDVQLVLQAEEHRLRTRRRREQRVKRDVGLRPRGVTMLL